MNAPESPPSPSAIATSRDAGGSLPQPTPAPAGAVLRLAIGKHGLGLELQDDVLLGCMVVRDLAIRIASVRFPIDVSGGVGRFRHRRGELEALELAVHSAAFCEWAAPRLRGLVGPRSPDVWAAFRSDGATIALIDRDEAGRVLAFELLFDAAGTTLRFVITDARGADLPAPATAIAIAAVGALVGDYATREGVLFAVERAAEQVTKSVLPEAGARIPDSQATFFSTIEVRGGTLVARAVRAAAPAPSSPRVLRAIEGATLSRSADDARASGDYDKARGLDLATLERAPRHFATSRKIAELDAHAQGRAESALALLKEAAPSESALLGTLRAELLAETGDVPSAVAAFLSAGDSEPVFALAARAFERAAELTRDPLDAVEYLNAAIARAPRMARLRWARIARRLATGQLDTALADVEHLEASARGAREKHAVWRRAGELWREAGLVGEASPLFERALLFVPDEPDSLAGLGSAMIAEGRAVRGITLLHRAIALADKTGQAAAAMIVELARALAEGLTDYPAAIARLRSIAETSPSAIEARALEGRYRATLGDLAGATLAFARLREASGSLSPELAETARDPGPHDAVVLYLIEAAVFERKVRADLHAAQRHVAAALRLAPRDPLAQRIYREICGELAPLPVPHARHADVTVGAAPQALGVLAAPEAPAAAPAPEPRAAFEPAETPFEPPATVAEPFDEATASARVDTLTQQLHANPNDDSVVEELADLLTRLERGHELLALLAGRYEDANAERKAALAPRAHAALDGLAADARKRGSDVEAQLFTDAKAMFT